MPEVHRNYLIDFFFYPFTIHFKKQSIPEHLMHRFMVQSISIIHKAEAFLSFDYSLINPELLGTRIWIICIVCQKKQCFG